VEIPAFLGTSVIEAYADDECPDHNEPARFKALAQGVAKPMGTKAMIRFARPCVPVVGVLGWV